MVQLRTSEPIPVLPGDRYVLRRESPITTLGGGQMLDVWAPRHRRRDKERAAAELVRLDAGERQVLLERAGPGGLSVADATLRAPGLGERLGDRVLATVALDALDTLLVERLDAWHAENPLAAGVGRRALHQGRLLALSAPAFDALIRRAVDAGRVELDGPRLRAAGWKIQPTSAQQAAADAVIKAVAALELEGPKLQELRAEHDPAVVTWLIEEGRLQRVGERVLARSRLDALADAVRGVLSEQGELTTGAFKELSGLSRRHAIPLLEWLDASGITRRDADTRRAGPAA
jgi:selenocysteine-specific elongation factor